MYIIRVSGKLVIEMSSQTCKDMKYYQKKINNALILKKYLRNYFCLHEAGIRLIIQEFSALVQAHQLICQLRYRVSNKVGLIWPLISNPSLCQATCSLSSCMRGDIQVFEYFWKTIFCTEWFSCIFKYIMLTSLITTCISKYAKIGIPVQ